MRQRGRGAGAVVLDADQVTTPGISTEDKNLLGIQQPNNSRTTRNVSDTLPLLSIIGTS
jgi:hypothetical protein